MPYCHNCGTSLYQVANFCPNCGTKVIASPFSSPAQPPVPASTPSYPPQLPPERPHNHNVYHAALGVLLILTIILGAGWSLTIARDTAGSAGVPPPYRYAVSDPPTQQSTQPPNTSTPAPQFLVWNSCEGGPSAGCNVTGLAWLEHGVPDTFDYFVSFTSTVPITVYFFTFGQLIQFAVCDGDVNCVSGYYRLFSATTSLQNSVFKLAEGCGDYVAVYLPAGNGVLYPDIRVTYNPAPYVTGYCAQISS